MWQCGHSKYRRVVAIGFSQSRPLKRTQSQCVQLQNHSARPRSGEFEIDQRYLARSSWRKRQAESIRVTHQMKNESPQNSFESPGAGLISLLRVLLDNRLLLGSALRNGPNGLRFVLQDNGN